MTNYCKHGHHRDECDTCHHEARISKLLTLAADVYAASDTLARIAKAPEKPELLPHRAWESICEASLAAQRAAYQLRILSAVHASGRRHVDAE